MLNKKGQSEHKREKANWITWMQKLLSLDNICPHTNIAKGLSQICPQDTTKFVEFFK